MRHLSNEKAAIKLKTIQTTIFLEFSVQNMHVTQKNNWQTRTHEKQGHQSDKGTPEVAELNHGQTIVSD